MAMRPSTWPVVQYNVFAALLVAVLFSGATRGAEKGSDFQIAEARKSVVLIRTIIPGLAPRAGSGFIVSDDGLIYTNRHVVRAADGDGAGTVILVGVPSAKDPDDLDFFKAEPVYVAADEDELDFAILKIAAKKDYGKFKPLAISSEKLGLGDSVAAIGYPQVDDDQPALSFTKGSVTSTRSKIHGRAYCQTDAAVNPGNSGGPLLNSKGEALGIVTLKKLDADNIGFALYISETQTARDSATKKASDVQPDPGPVDPKTIGGPAGIKPIAKNWTAGGDTVVKEEKGFLSLDRAGGEYWVVSQQELPDDFQLLVPCRVEFFKGRQVIYESQRSILRTLVIRFGTDDIKSSIMEPKGYEIQFSHEHLFLYKEGEIVKNEPVGNVDVPLTLALTKKGGDFTLSAEGHKLLTWHDDKPLSGKQKFCIGGYLSRMELGEVQVVDLAAVSKEKKDK